MKSVDNFRLNEYNSIIKESDVINLLNTYENGTDKRYWIPEQDEGYEDFKDIINITLGKRYEIIVDDDESIYFIDDKGNRSLIFIGHNGRFEN